MRLVGATRWFIRWPFMLEGVVVGVAGGLVAILILWLGKITIVDPLSKTLHFLEAQNSTAVNFPELVVAPLRRRGHRLDARLRARRCGASSRSEAGVRTRGAVAFAVALVVALGVGLWLGGHPTEAAAVPARTLRRRARRADRGSGGTDPGQLLPRGRRHRARATPRCRGWSASCAAATTTASPTTSRRRASPPSTSRSKATSRGSGSSIVPAKKGLRVVTVFPGSPAAKAGIVPGDTIVSVEGESLARRRHRSRGGEDQGPGRDRRDDRRARREDRQDPGRDADPGPGDAAQREQPGEDGRTGASSATCGCSASAKTRTRSWRRRSKRSTARGRKGSSSTCAATPAACWTRRCRAPPSSSPRAKSW